MKRAPTSEGEVFFTDGVLASENTAIVTAGFSEAPESTASRIYFKFAERWKCKTLDTDFAVSAAYVAGKFFVVGRNGLIVHGGSRGLPFNEENIRGQIRTYQISEVAERGHLSRVEAVGEEFLACGWGGQVYRLFEQRWERMEEGIDVRRENDLLHIAGQFPSDLYAVGLGGVLLHFDGKRWAYLDSPTNNHLFSVLYISASEVYLTGSEGGIFRGNRDRWEFVGNPTMQENCWSAAKYMNALYVTHGDNGLSKLEDQAFSEVNFGLNEQPYTHRLSGGYGKLLSAGSHDLLLFDGQMWNPLFCPDNE